jgi:hypothetical protein
VLDYLGRYVFRIAIANSRLDQVTDDDVTFRYRDNRSQEVRRVTLTGVEFLERFLQHVLPRGCAKVRYYGLWSVAHRADRTHARALLTAAARLATPSAPEPARTSSIGDLPRCPHCRVGTLIVMRSCDRRGAGRHELAMLTPLSASSLNTPIGRARRRVVDHPCTQVTDVAGRRHRRSHPRSPHRQTAGDRPPRRLTAPVTR